MTAKELKARLKEMPDNAEVVFMHDVENEVVPMILEIGTVLLNANTVILAEDLKKKTVKQWECENKRRQK